VVVVVVARGQWDDHNDRDKTENSMGLIKDTRVSSDFFPICPCLPIPHPLVLFFRKKWNISAANIKNKR